ncbi:MAG: peptidoglycan binding domain-containing protein [Lachnospiraceae bacterium]|nr:peptidoglycan binding domain-containing protein [Lachnospiraceae bacterium]
MKKPSKKFWIILGSILGVLVVAFVGMGFFFESHFFLRSTVNGVNSSGATAAAMETRLTEATQGYQLTLVEADGKTEVLSTQDLGMETNIEQERLQELINDQNGFLWVYYLIAGKEYQDETLVSCDRSTIAKSVSKLSCVTNKHPIETKNANVSYRSGEFVIVDEVYGTELDQTDLARKIQRAVLSLKKELDLKEDACYKQPKYTADSKEVKELKKTLNKYLSTEIVYQVGSSTEKIPKETMGAWLSGNDKLEPVFDREAMADFVAQMSRKYDTYGQAKQLATQYGVTVTVPGGNYGWRIDREKEVEQLIEDISTGKKVQRDFTYQYKAASREDNDYGNSYVEINKTAQHLYLVINGAVVLETPMVSGKNVPEHDTPVGAYRITYCEKNATLRGPGYCTKVAYWMPFNGDIGLHDATWQSSFGGARYKEGYGSHGCVNLPLSAAGTIFSYVSAGFPVLMYDLPGTETVDTLAIQAAENCKNAINAIGAVDGNSGPVIGAARGAYDALTDSAKSCVDNYQVLLDAEAAYAGIRAAEDAQAMAQAEAQAKAQAVVDMINAIGTVTADSVDNIVAAEKAYNALSDLAKSYVTNYDLLVQARKELDSLN